MTTIKDAANELMSDAVSDQIASLAYVYVDRAGNVRSEIIEGDEQIVLLGGLTLLKAQLVAQMIDDDEEAPDSEPESEPAETEAERTGEDP